MHQVPCPVSAEELQRLHHEEKLTDEAIALRLGDDATVKRVRAWRKRFGIVTLSRTLRSDVPPIEGRLRSLLVGSMLGDGRLSRTAHAARYHERHCVAQKDYLAWKIRQLGSWVQTEMQPVVREFPAWRIHTVSHPSLLEWHAMFYDLGVDAPKRLDPKVIPLVDAFALAVWFMDDGSTGWWPRITFGMSPVSRGIAMGIFSAFGLHPRWETCKGNTGNFIFEGEDQAHHFIEFVNPHIHDCMKSKLVFGFQGPHYRVRQALTEQVLRDRASRDVPLKQIAREFGVGEATVSRHLVEWGIPHLRRRGRPPRVKLV